MAKGKQSVSEAMRLISDDREADMTRRLPDDAIRSTDAI
jgi:hypothetical protein